MMNTTRRSSMRLSPEMDSPLPHVPLAEAWSEQLIGLDDAAAQALLMNIAAECRQRRPVRFKTIGPEVLTEDAPRLLDMIEQKRQSDAQRVGVIETLDRNIARLLEGLVKACGHPGAFAMHIFAD